jgi:hypothetical protein
LVKVKKDATTAMECVSNINSCMKIMENNEAGKDQCETCYPGYLKTTKTKKCLWCKTDDVGCSTCKELEEDIECTACMVGFYFKEK